MDWNRRTCARRGHLTYSPDEEHLRDRLHVATPVGEAWRCLRCGDYTVGAPGGSGPAESGPLMVRGAVLREQLALRALAVERVVRSMVLLAAAYGVWRVQDVQTSLPKVFTEDLPELGPVATELADLFGGSAVLHLVESATPEGTGRLPWVSLGLLAFALVRLTEGGGLWLGRRWAVYGAAVIGALSIPVEMFSLVSEVRWAALLALPVGAAIVGHLVYAHRLFGVRGGRRSIVRARRVEAMLEVVRAAGTSR